VVPFTAYKWEDLGAQLLDTHSDCQSVLSVIKANHPQNVEECCKCVLKKWLETKPDASWSQLIQALESPSVQLNNVASNINELTRKG